VDSAASHSQSLSNVGRGAIQMQHHMLLVEHST